MATNLTFPILATLRERKEAFTTEDQIARLVAHEDRLDIGNSLQILRDRGLVTECFIRRPKDGLLSSVGWMLTLAGNSSSAGDKYPRAAAVYVRVVATCPSCGNETPEPGGQAVTPGVVRCWNCGTEYLVTRDAVVGAEVRP